ncbi:MAG: ThiF family adenylyltransferase [Desulfovermiculus sp.]|nr:ThiF family adenylyltransferase [Desulfovermiculus sp.]
MTGPLDLDLSAYRADLTEELAAVSTQSHVPTREELLSTITQRQINALHHKLGVPIPVIYRAALEQGILPLRYLRNYPSLAISEQLQLACTTVAVVGAGGLGGEVLLCLARVGVGRLIVVDPGRFDETNLNRQALCTPNSLEMTKVHTAKNTIQELNPGVEMVIHPIRLTPENRGHILVGADVAVDALDSVQDRLVLEQGTKDAGIPLVHAAIDGFLGQLMTVYPQDNGLTQIYGSETSQASSRGNLPMTALSMANLQAMEVLKILLGRGRTIRNQLLTMELEEGLIELFSFPPLHFEPAGDER